MHFSLVIYLHKAQGQVTPQLATPIRLENIRVKNSFNEKLEELDYLQIFL
jgi:hypothetical protein